MVETGVKTKKAPGMHSFTKKVCHWWYCAKCGLVALKNEPSQAAMKRRCDDGER